MLMTMMILVSGFFLSPPFFFYFFFLIIYLPIHLVKLEKLGIVSEMGKPYNLNFKVAFLKKIMLFGVAFDLKKKPSFFTFTFYFRGR